MTWLVAPKVACAARSADNGSTDVAKTAPSDLPQQRQRLGCTAAAPVRPLRYVGGVDISFTKNSSDNACASLVVLSFPELIVVHQLHARVTMTLPYISGFLAFREVEHIAALVERLRAERPDLLPDVVFVDGNGVLHPRGAGLASHLGVLCNLRTIGIGKTFLHIDGLTRDGVRAACGALPPEARGEYELRGDSGTVWGRALCFNDSVTAPIFVSVGHRVALQTAVALTRACCLYRMPEPVRQADILSRALVREWQGEDAAGMGAAAEGGLIRGDCG
ncbi:endonuclease V-domain-containing protein [Tribonema minus]|uniref:Endonuclease V-domain-containing protein n=1 Tax=Tribonema minus TaxID=303371 RepID=A0A835YW13_9STRA|nr:endonuclease V-domain-containing protein [Tribonema minus]